MPEGARHAAADISFEPGDKAGFITVVDGQEDSHLILSAADNHLTGNLVRDGR